MELSISPAEQRCLLAEARETIAAKLEKRRPRYAAAVAEAAAGEGPAAGELTVAGKSAAAAGSPAAGKSALAKNCGAFVTLHLETDRGRQLRGCIGRMSAAGPLGETVRAMALEAAFGDPRFPPLGPEELPRCSIEISALSPMELCPDPRQVEVGVHGLYLIRQGRAGVLLPQVPVEQGWNRDEYLDYICVKAGLPPGSYEAPDAKLFTFTAIVFGED
jgi:AmmeMemoRadiSam system protein A